MLESKPALDAAAGPSTDQQRSAFLGKVDGRLVEYDEAISQLKSLSIIDAVPTYQSNMSGYLNVQRQSGDIIIDYRKQALGLSALSLQTRFQNGRIDNQIKGTTRYGNIDGNVTISQNFGNAITQAPVNGRIRLNAPDLEAFKNLMPLLGMGGETEKGIALPILPWWNAVAINDVPAQSDFYSSANGRLLNDLVRDAREPEKVALLQKVWRQRLSYRLVRSAEESKIALSSVAETRASLPFISDELATLISQQGLESALSQPLARILEQVQLALDNAQEKPDVIYLTGGSARSPLIKKALAEQLPGIPIAGGDDFGSVTAGLARWAEVVFR